MRVTDVMIDSSQQLSLSPVITAPCTGRNDERVCARGVLSSAGSNGNRFLPLVMRHADVGQKVARRTIELNPTKPMACFKPGLSSRGALRAMAIQLGCFVAARRRFSQ